MFLTDGASDETWGTGGRTAANYDVTMTEDGSGGHFVGTFDTSANISEGTYRVTIFKQEGGTPVDSDKAIAQGEIYWDGLAEINFLTLSSEGSRLLNIYGPGE